MSQGLTADDIRPRITSMAVEVTTACSLKCVGCARTIGHAAGVWHDRHMSAALFARICPNLPRLRLVMLHGIGEPTLNPEYPRIVECAARSGRFDVVSANTHALSRSIAYYRGLVDAGMSHLAISVDSLTQEIADRTRTGTDVRRLRAQLEGIAALPVAVTITVVASRINRTDIVQTLDTLDGLGRFLVHVQPFLDLGHPEGCLTPDDTRALHHLVTQGADTRWANLTIQSSLVFGGASEGTLCDAPWASPAVTVDGFLTPCCVMWDPATLGFVNVAEMSVEAAFARPSVQAFLEAYVQRAPGFCRACHMNSRPVQDAFVPLLRHPSRREIPVAS
ncbi:MAG: radical SAM protein [Acidobacteriota bacterium]